MSRFWVTAQILEKCTEWPKWPWHVQGQNTNMHAMHTPLSLSEAQIFVPLALRWAVLGLHSFLGKVAIWYNIWKSCLSTPGGHNWANFCSTGTSFQDAGWFSKLPYIWAWNLAIRQSCTYTCTLFLPQAVKLELIYALRAAVSKIRADFQTCHIWAWNLAIPKFQKLHINSLSTPGTQNWAYFRSMSSGSRDMGRFSKLPYLGKCQKCHRWTLKQVHAMPPPQLVTC